MSTVGIVGCEAAKFTSATEAEARLAIREVCDGYSCVVSGRSPLGGIDWWAIEEGRALGLATHEYPATRSSWDGPGGFKERNLAIARAGDLVVCISVKTLPDSYRGRRFPQGCYHCHTPPDHHIKSGGCWTMHQAARLGHQTRLIVIG